MLGRLAAKCRKIGNLLNFAGKRQEMDRKIYAVVVAGGSGTRMGAELPKQFLQLSGKYILQRTLENFMEAVPDVRLVTVLPRRWMKAWKEMCLAASFDCPQTLVAGGITRYLSVRNALEKVPDGALVAIHDGVRPFAGPELIRRMLGMMSDSVRALIPVVPVVDTLKSLDPALPDPVRSSTVAVQTPQIFFSEDIKKAYAQPYDPSFTDDASVAARAGIPVTTTEGERFNIKITTREDLVFGEAILSLRRP